MPLLEWNDSLKLGHTQIDSDHKKMVDLLNRLYEATITDRGSRVCSSILSDLIAYTKSHFALEEQLMVIRRYDMLDEHRAEHSALMKDVVALQSRLDRDISRLDCAQFEFLKAWVSNHILDSDRALVAALVSHVIAPAS